MPRQGMTTTTDRCRHDRRRAEADRRSRSRQPRPPTRRSPSSRRSSTRPTSGPSARRPSWKTFASGRSASWPTSAATPSSPSSATCSPSSITSSGRSKPRRAKRARIGSGACSTACKLVATQLEAVLKQHQCVPIETVGTPFDPNLHQAIAQEPSDEHPAGTVTRAAQAGYKLHDRVIRPAQVFVSTGPAA